MEGVDDVGIGKKEDEDADGGEEEEGRRRWRGVVDLW